MDQGTDLHKLPKIEPNVIENFSTNIPPYRNLSPVWDDKLLSRSENQELSVSKRECQTEALAFKPGNMASK